MKSIWELNFKDLVSPGIAKMTGVVNKSFAQIGMHEKNVQSIMDKTNGSIQKQTSLFGGLGGSIAGALGFAGAIGTVTALGYGILKVGSNMEQTRIGFQTLLGDVSAANEKIKELQRFADVSPFNTQEVLDAGTSLLGFGVEAKNLLPIMNKLGDASMGNATRFQSLVDNYGKMVGAQRANTIDLNQFAIAGVPIWREVGKIVGKNGQDLRKYVETNGVSLKIIDQAFNNLTASGGQFHGMMAAQSQSTLGLWSTFVAAIEEKGIKAFNAIQPFLNDMIRFGQSILPTVENAFVGVWNIVSSVFGFIKQHDLIFTMLAGGATALAIAMGAVSAATWLFTGAMAAVNMVMAISPIGWVVISIGALVAGIIYAWNHFEGFRKVVLGLWDSFKQVFTNIGNFFKATFEPIFEAITAFKEGRYIDAAKSVAKTAYNLTPYGMAANAGILTEGVGAAYDSGAAKAARGSNKASAAAQTSSPTATGALPFSSKAGSAGAEATGSSAGGSLSSAKGGGGGKSVVIEIKNLIGNITFSKTVGESETELKSRVTQILLSAVNDTQIAID